MKDVDIDFRSVFANALLVVVSVGLVIGGLEAALQIGLIPSEAQYPKYRICEPGDRTAPQAGMDHEHQYHPRYGWIGVPERQFIVRKTSTEDFDRYTHNERGFRDTFQSGQRTAIVVGDSFTYGVLADDGSTFPRLLDAASSEMRFENYGMAGYGTAQEYLVYKDVANRTDHQLVVLGYFYNDPRDNMGYDAVGDPLPLRPRMTVQDGSLVLSHRPIRPEQVGTSRTSIDKIKSFLEKKTASYPFFASRLLSLQYKVGLRSPNDTIAPETIDRRLRITRALVNGIAAEAARNDAKFVVVMIPPRRLANRTLENGVYNRSYWNQQKVMLNQIAKNQSGVQVVDLEPRLRQNIDNGRAMYDRNDQHLNEQGYLVTANVIHEQLVRMGQLNSTNSEITALNETGGSKCQTGGGGG